MPREQKPSLRQVSAQTAAGATLSLDLARAASLGQRFGLRLIVLFGSRAKGRPAPTSESDIDIAILGCPEGRFWDCYGELAEIVGEYSLDLVELEKADSLFRYEVMSDGVRLYGDPDLFFEYRAYAYKDFVDSADLRALEDALFRKKMVYLRQELHGSR